MALDISERKRAEAVLQESEEKLRSITESARDYVFIKERSRHYTFVNSAIQQIIGLPASRSDHRIPPRDLRAIGAGGRSSSGRPDEDRRHPRQRERDQALSRRQDRDHTVADHPDATIASTAPPPATEALRSTKVPARPE